MPSVWCCRFDSWIGRRRVETTNSNSCISRDYTGYTARERLKKFARDKSCLPSPPSYAFACTVVCLSTFITNTDNGQSFESFQFLLSDVVCRCNVALLPLVCIAFSALTVLWILNFSDNTLRRPKAPLSTLACRFSSCCFSAKERKLSEQHTRLVQGLGKGGLWCQLTPLNLELRSEIAYGTYVRQVSK